ncbi:hypothetical protein [Pseudactinotalea sp. Z1748]|uniref:hypothetical protein n=1 Tax=Pseudactinotalea sp. Z1748 TaxID=3413027 RepID=UPI003C79D3A1
MSHPKRYPTRAEAIEQSLVPALAEHTDDVDVDAVFEATFTYTVECDGAGDEIECTGGYESAATEGEIWSVAADHAQRIIIVDSEPPGGEDHEAPGQISVTIPSTRVEVEVLSLPARLRPDTWEKLIDQRLREANWRRVSEWEDGANRVRAMVVRI